MQSDPSTARQDAPCSSQGLRTKWLQIRALIKLTLLELYRRKDLPAVFILAAVILLPLTLFTPFGAAGASRAMNEVAMLLIWLFSLIITMGVAARLFPAEYERRTILPLLSKPVSRGTLLIGKFLGGWIASLSALLLFYLTYVLLAVVRQGVWPGVILWQALLLHAALLGLVTALTVAGSLWLTASANFTLCGLLIGGMLFFGQQMPQLAAQQSQPGRTLLLAIHWLAPHMEFFDLRQRLVHAWPTLEWYVVALVLLYATLYGSAILAAAHTFFRRKKL